MDWYSRYVISWIIADTLSIEPVLEAANVALATAKPEIMNTDQGSDFTSPQFTRLFLNKDVNISMDHRGRCFDNIMVERLWRSVKYEKVYLSEFSSPRELKRALADYFALYNNRRPHQSLDNNYPADVFGGSVKINIPARGSVKQRKIVPCELIFEPRPSPALPSSKAGGKGEKRF
jgi:putative transposase